MTSLRPPTVDLEPEEGDDGAADAVADGAGVVSRVASVHGGDVQLRTVGPVPTGRQRTVLPADRPAEDWAEAETDCSGLWNIAGPEHNIWLTGIQRADLRSQSSVRQLILSPLPR